MKVLMLDPTRTKISCEYNGWVDGKGWNNQSFTGLLAEFLPSQFDAVRLNQQYVDSSGKGDPFTCIIATKLDPGFSQPVMSGSVELITHRVNTPQYLKRLKAGEVLMNPYAKGKYTWKRQALANSVSGAGAKPVSSYGWYSWHNPQVYSPPAAASSLQFLLDSKGIPRIAPPNYRNGAPLRAYQVYFSFAWYDVGASSIVYSPAPSVAFGDVSVDTALVTQVVADRNNGEYDLLTEIAEMPETLAFLGESVSKVFFMTCDLDAEARLKRLQMGPGKRFAKWFSDHWLRGRYALLPIMYSIMDIQKSLEVMGQEYAEYKSQVSIDSQHTSAGAGIVQEIEHNAIHRCFIKSRYTAESILSDIRRILNVNLFSTLWQTQTLSFVVDWAVNINDYIEALTGNDGSLESACCYSVRDKSVIKLHYDSPDPNVAAPVTVVKLDTYQRIIIDPSDHIGLTFVATRTFNWKRAVDAFSLSVQPGLTAIKRLTKI